MIIIYIKIRWQYNKCWKWTKGKVKIKKGVREEFVPPPMAFNLFNIKELIKEFKNNIDTGIEIQGKKITMYT